MTAMPDGRAASSAVLAIGETMAMVAPRDAESLSDAFDFRVEAGGAESNVAVHVAALGFGSAWFSRLGDDSLGRRIAKQLAQKGVDVSSVVFDARHRTGVYVKDPGRSVLYYRTGSAASHLSPADAEGIEFTGIAVVHLSGITAAISSSAAGFLRRAIERARSAGVLVSFDVNYRAQLWSKEDAAPILLGLARNADIVFVGRDEAEALWGHGTPASIRDLLPDVPELVVKDADIGATAFIADGTWFEPSPSVAVVEAIGAGDAFAAAFLVARILGHGPRERVIAGHARAALVMSTTSDTVSDAVVAELVAR